MEYLDAVYTVADYLGFHRELFLDCIEEDEIGGYDPDVKLRTFNGPWTVEMQFLYAIVRFTKPCHVLEVGNVWGNSTRHICAALRKNGCGDLFSIDLQSNFMNSEAAKQFADIARFEVMDVFDFDFALNSHIDFVFDDSAKTTEEVGHVWANFAEYMSPGAVIVAHDSEHFRLGPLVKTGIERTLSPDDYCSVQIHPALCGLAIWRKV